MSPVGRPHVRRWDEPAQNFIHLYETTERIVFAVSPRPTLL